MTAAAELVAVAQGELGYTETGPGPNRTKYGEWFGMQDAWCGIFVSWCADRAGAAAVIPRFAWTPSGAQWFIARQAFDEHPRVGDIAFYDLGAGRISHCGVVVQVHNDSGWESIEGNSGTDTNRVVQHTRHSVGQRGGFGHPHWSGPAPSTPDRNSIRLGSRGASVQIAQMRLVLALDAAGRGRIAVDGIFGKATDAAVRWFQADRGLSVDGIIGQHTWDALG